MSVTSAPTAASGWGGAAQRDRIGRETAKRDKPRRQSPVIPRAQPALRTLMIAMSVMCYLASLAIGGLILINRAVDSWTTDMAREVTVQVRPVQGHEGETDLPRAAELIGNFAGITEVRVLGRAAAAELLEPWLGRGRLIEDLPVPRLITVGIDRRNPPDLDRLASLLEAEVAGVSLDTHRHWQRELSRLAAAMQWLGLAILFLVLCSAVTLVIQVTRTALEANREAVEVLYLVGATDRFIARAVERRFLVAGLAGGIAGTALGIATFAAVTFTGYAAAPSGLAEASRSLVFGPSAEAMHAYLLFLLVPLGATLICLVTARLAVLKILRKAF
jgi:cell division transport system permease protein